MKGLNLFLLAGSLLLAGSWSIENRAQAQGSGVHGEKELEAMRAFLEDYITNDLTKDARFFFANFKLADIPETQPKLRRVFAQMIFQGLGTELLGPQKLRTGKDLCPAGAGVCAYLNDRGGTIDFDLWVLDDVYQPLNDSTIKARLVASFFHEKAHQHGFPDRDALLVSGYIRARFVSLSRSARPMLPTRPLGIEPAGCIRTYSALIDRLEKQYPSTIGADSERATRALSASSVFGAYACGVGLPLANLLVPFTLFSPMNLKCDTDPGPPGLERLLLGPVLKGVFDYQAKFERAQRALVAGEMLTEEEANMLHADLKLGERILNESLSDHAEAFGGALETFYSENDSFQPRWTANFSLVQERFDLFLSAEQACRYSVPSVAQIGYFSAVDFWRMPRAIVVQLFR